MYHVTLTYSENEPWWFFEDWQTDIIEEHPFDTFEEAETYFVTCYKKLTKDYDDSRCKNPYLVAFWNEDELIYCEDCDEDLQAYKGLMLLKDGEKLNDGDNENDETANYNGKTKCCQRLGKSVRSDTKE